MDWILHLNIHSTVRQETQALGHNRSFARRAKTQLFRERESPNETALKLPASIAAPCCLSPLTPLHVRPSHMRRETKPLRGMGTTTAPQARGRARCCSACSHRGASAAAPALRGRCAASVRGRPRGRLFSLPPTTPSTTCVRMYVCMCTCTCRVCCVLCVCTGGAPAGRAGLRTARHAGVHPRVGRPALRMECRGVASAGWTPVGRGPPPEPRC